MDFGFNHMPSSMKEVEWHWKQTIRDDFNLAKIIIDGECVDFNYPVDYFALSDTAADEISRIGQEYNIFSQPVYLNNFGLNIWGDLKIDSNIGTLLNSIKNFRPEAEVYGLFARYKYIGKSVFCSVTICFVDKDYANEMETAVFEIGEDEGSYILPVAINETVSDYYSFDDLAKLTYWLGDFWAGVQYKLNNCPREIHEVVQRDSMLIGSGKYQGDDRIVLVKHMVTVDENGNELKYDNKKSKRQYRMPAWGVRGHDRHLNDGRIIPVRPYPKGKERNNPDALVKKEYSFLDNSEK